MNVNRYIEQVKSNSISQLVLTNCVININDFVKLIDALTVNITVHTVNLFILTLVTLSQMKHCFTTDMQYYQ